MLQEVTCFAGHAGGSGRGPCQCQQLPPDPCHRAPTLPTEREGKCRAAPADLMLNDSFSWSKSCQEGLGADGLCERCSCLLSTKPLIRARRWEGGELLYKQSFKINCFSSLEQELAFQPQDTIRACSDCIFSGAVYSQGCLAGAG